MKRPLISILLFFSFLEYAVIAQEVPVDSGLLRDIVHGHQLLTQYTECLSGKIEPFVGSSNTGEPDISPGRRFLFFRDKDLLRLEYINPLKNTEIFQGHDKNDVTEVIMRSKDHYFQYMAVPTTGVPFANLWRSTVPSEELKLTLGSDFYSRINALVAVNGTVDFKVIDLLQDKIGSIENRQYNDIPDALWIKSIMNMDKAGNSSHWMVVMNPKQHYALLFFVFRVENSKTGFLATSSTTVSAQVTDNGKIFPKEIVFKGQTKTSANGQKQELDTGSRSLITILSTDKIDDKLFTEESFKNLGRDYTVVDVLPNQKRADSGYVVNAAPLKSRMPHYPIDEFAKSEWMSWKRIMVLSVGILLIAVGGLRLYFQLRFKNK
jgi:hypothetical protein